MVLGTINISDTADADTHVFMADKITGAIFS